MTGSKSGTNTTSKDGFDFHMTSWENSGEDGDKGSRTSSDWEAKGGGWTRKPKTVHKTDQNVKKGKDGRHPD